MTAMSNAGVKRDVADPTVDRRFLVSPTSRREALIAGRILEAVVIMIHIAADRGARAGRYVLAGGVVVLFGLALRSELKPFSR